MLAIKEITQHWRWLGLHRKAIGREVQAINYKDFMGDETLHDKNKTRELPTVTVKREKTVKHFLLQLLQRLFPAERPTEDELIAYGAVQEREKQKHQERERQQHLGRTCEVHPYQKLQRVEIGKYECPVCMEKQTGPIERPLMNYLRNHHAEVGPNTQEHRAIHTGKLKPELEKER